MRWRGCCVRGLGDQRTRPRLPRARSRAEFPAPTLKTWCCLDDLLGIARSRCRATRYRRDARRRRLTALVNAAALARTDPALYVIEDAHWIDEASESMLADFLAVIPQTRRLVLITYRPEYRGALARAAERRRWHCGRLTSAQASALTVNCWARTRRSTRLAERD